MKYKDGYKELTRERYGKDAPDTDSKKKCIDCGRERIAEHFSKNRRNKDGLANRCRSCNNRKVYKRAERLNPLSDANIDKKIAEFFND